MALQSGQEIHNVLLIIMAVAMHLVYFLCPWRIFLNFSMRLIFAMYDLKKQHAAGPDRRSATEPRQNKSTDQGLHLKQQKGADKDCQSITQHADSLGKKSALYCACTQKEVPHDAHSTNTYGQSSTRLTRCSRFTGV